LSAATVNGKIYVFGGIPNDNSDVAATVEEYDPNTDTWTVKSTMPAPAWNMAIAAVNGKIYVFGGQHGMQNLASVYMYDPAGNTWTQKTTWPTADNTYGRLATSSGNLILIPSGVYIDQYDTSKD
jgi:N-acetylneuraminic acid mutarotase